MSLPYMVRRVSAALNATETGSLFIDDSISTVPVVLCMVKPSNAVTAVTAQVTMSDDGTTFYPIQDEAKAELDFDIEANAYTRLPPTDYAVFAQYIRLEFSAGLSAATDFDLYFRPA